MQDRATWHNFSQGPLKQTGNPLDVAIDGDAFLVVQTARGERYTRNGALQINATGQLVTSTGDPVLGDGEPIQFQTTDHDTSIDPDGTITVREGASTFPIPRAENCSSSISTSRPTAEARIEPVRGAQRSGLAACADGRLVQGAIDVEREPRRRNGAHDRNHPHLRADRQHPAADDRTRRCAIDKLADVPA